MATELTKREPSLGLGSGAEEALQLYYRYGSTAVALQESRHAATLIGLGLERDVAYCAQRDRFSVVPRLRSETGLLTLRKG